MKRFGVFCEGDTFAHRLDPRTKLTFVVLFFVAAFVAQGPMLAAVAAVAVAALASARMGVRQAFAMLRPFVWLLLFVAVFDVLFTRSGAVLFAAGPVSVTWGGVAFAVESVLRFCCMLLGTSALMYTTSPTALTDGFSLLLRPLARLGLRVDDAALALGMTLRFIPVVSDEFARVKEAQQARLADFGGGAVRRLKAYGSVFMPLFSGALRRADTLALAIQNREYDGGVRRTCIRVYRPRPADGAVLALAVLLCVAAFAIG